MVGEKLRTIPKLQDVNSDLQNRALQTGLVIDRDTASHLGLTPQAIDNALHDAFGQRHVSTMYEGTNQFHGQMLTFHTTPVVYLYLDRFALGSAARKYFGRL